VAVHLGTAVIIDRLGSLELTPPAASAAAIYDPPIGLRLLHQDPASGEEHYLVRYPPGVRGLPDAHTSAHTIVEPVHQGFDPIVTHRSILARHPAEPGRRCGPVRVDAEQGKSAYA
jgi:hypothetical protein